MRWKKARLVCKYQVRWYRWFVASSCFFPIVVECAERQYTTREEKKTQHWHPLLERYRITLQRRFSHGLGVCVTHLHFAVYFIFFLNLLGSLTHFGSPLEQFDCLICNQLFYNLAARWRAVFCVFRVPCVLRTLFMDQRNSIAATHQHNHHVKTDTYNLWYSFLLKCTLFYLLPFAFCIFVSS